MPQGGENVYSWVQLGVMALLVAATIGGWLVNFRLMRSSLERMESRTQAIELQLATIQGGVSSLGGSFNKHEAADETRFNSLEADVRRVGENLGGRLEGLTRDLGRLEGAAAKGRP